MIPCAYNLSVLSTHNRHVFVVVMESKIINLKVTHYLTMDTVLTLQSTPWWQLYHQFNLTLITLPYWTLTMFLKLCPCHMYGVEHKLMTYAKNEVYIPDLIIPQPVTADWLYIQMVVDEVTYVMTWHFTFTLVHIITILAMLLLWVNKNMIQIMMEWYGTMQIFWITEGPIVI